MEDAGTTRELAVENDRLRHLHRLLAAELAEATGRAGTAAAVMTEETDSSRFQRDLAVGTWSDRATRLRAARNGLAFGRLDHPAGPPTYVGRTGLADADGETALVDWRAPAARPFYCATVATPEGVTRRRHLRLAGLGPQERVVALHDDILDVGAADISADTAADPALLAALTAPRSGTMRDIVSTIQGEQDAIIRLPLTGTVVVEGGPGTGKTAVALHRVAYLLYAHREQLARRGVLVVGPSAAFLRYVADVLPSLGETAVVFTTPGGLRHGIDTAALDAPEVARIKGELSILDVLRRAVAQRQELPAEPLRIELDDVTVEVDAELVHEARDAARASGLPHNAARAVFRDALGTALVRDAVLRIGDGWLDQRELTGTLGRELAGDVRRELATHRGFHAAVEELWPLCTPERLLAELLGDRDRLAALDPALVVLHRAQGDAWTVSDAPLLDELVELLGEVERPEPESRGLDDTARRVLEALDEVESDEEFALRATDVLNTATLAERHTERDLRTVAERAAADRDWTFGHVVVDEAQELSPMDWRVLVRRCPTRSMTVVGDLAQRSAAAGSRTWDVGPRAVHRTLTINYRTPAEIMDRAAQVLPEIGPGLEAPRSVRHSGELPWERTVDRADLGVELVAAVAADRPDAGTMAVIAPEPAALPDLDPDVTVLTPPESKGQEFDVVIVVDPDGIRAGCPADLYVALTRATQRLGILAVR
ncbi:UvrD-helicase domain-containing protein [Pseudonocardia sp. CA-107938]|uniref:UvrD-helicase domain-containing protein n=1 Tax=Pseudonocardia sp. CA-107938 TaxID=3240021 RepID=UPI003D8C6AA9